MVAQEDEVEGENRQGVEEEVIEGMEGKDKQDNSNGAASPQPEEVVEVPFR